MVDSTSQLVLFVFSGVLEQIDCILHLFLLFPDQVWSITQLLSLEWRIKKHYLFSSTDPEDTRLIGWLISL